MRKKREKRKNKKERKKKNTGVHKTRRHVSHNERRHSFPEVVAVTDCYQRDRVDSSSTYDVGNLDERVKFRRDMKRCQSESVSALIRCKSHTPRHHNTLSSIYEAHDGKLHATYDEGTLVGCPVGLEIKSGHGVSKNVREISTIKCNGISYTDA